MNETMTKENTNSTKDTQPIIENKTNSLQTNAPETNLNSNKKKVRYTEIIYEVQRRKGIIFSPFSNQSEWLDVHGKKKTKEQVILPEGWQWISDWKHEGGDAWEYAPKWGNNWSSVEGPLDFVRRKKWFRYRVKYVTDSELRELEGHVEVINQSDSIYSGVESFARTLKNKLENIASKTEKPNILLLGGSGAGKSSLVNAVFGKTLAEIGEGKPITQTYTKYSSDSSPVVIYDSRGIEHGYVEKGFIADTKKFFKRLREEPSLENHIHCVWYVLDLTQARFQPFEAEFCRNYLKDIPIIFVLNKADAVTDQVRETMMKTIADFKLPNCRGIIVTVANCKNFDSKTCVKCGSGRIRKRLQKGTCTTICKDCKEKVVMEKTSNIEELKQITLSVMPDLVKSVFLISQRDEILGAEPKAKKIIAKYAESQSLYKTENIGPQLEAMCSELVNLYGMSMISKIVSQEIVKRYVKFYHDQRAAKKFAMYLGDLFRDLFKKQSVAQALFIVSGLEVCRAVINFKKGAISTTIVHTNSKNGEASENSENKISEKVFIKGQKLTTEYDAEWAIEKLLAQMNFNIDSAIIRNIHNELQEKKNVDKFLEKIRIDGTDYSKQQKSESVLD